MNARFFISLLLACTGLWPSFGFAQLVEHPNLDSLQTQLKKCTSDNERIPVLLNIANSYVVRPGELRADLDSALLIAKQSELLNKTLNNYKYRGLCLLVYSRLFHERKDSAQAAMYGQQALSVLADHRFFLEAGDVALTMSYYYDPENETQCATAIRLSESAAMYYRWAGNDVERAVAYDRIGDLYSSANNIRKADDTLMAALQINAHTPIRNLVSVYRNISFAKQEMGNYDLALKYLLLSLHTAEQMNKYDDDTKAIYTHLGILYYRIDDLDDAILYFRKAFDLANRNKSLDYIQQIIANMVSTFNKMGAFERSLAFQDSCERRYPPGIDIYSGLHPALNRCETFIAMGNYKAMQPYIGALKKFITGGDSIEIALQGYGLLIPWLIYKKDYSGAQKMLDSRMRILSKGIDVRPENVLQSTLLQYQIDSAAQLYQKALLDYKKYTALNDSLVNIRKLNQISHLKIEYESDKKDQNIELLSRESKISRLDLANTRSVRNMMIFGAIALVLLLGLLFNRYRLKARTNAALEAQQLKISQQNRLLQAALAEKDGLIVEKEWLMKEIHHRVKNNLQIIISLLRIQSSYLDDGEALRTMRESRQRLQAIALLHQKLYQADQVEVIDMEAYIKELISYLEDSFGGLSNVRFDLHIAPLRLQLGHAVPIGLIINEAVTNSIKYAFPDGRKGTIKIFLQVTAEGLLVLSINDNGIGMDTSELSNGSATMGLRLVQMLSDQMHGKLNINSNSGFSINITDIPFPDDPAGMSRQ